MPRPPVHPLLVAAHEAIDPRTSRWNPQHQSLITWNLPHLGGPQPVVPRKTQADLVLWCAQVVAPLVRTRSTNAELTRLLAAARAPEFATSATAREVIAGLRALEPNAPQDDDPLQLAGLAAVAAERIVSRSWRNAHRTAVQSVIYATRALLRRRDPDAMSPEAFIDALDDMLLRAEWSGFADRTTTARRLHGEAGTRLEALLYRAGDDKGDGVVWVARLKSTTGPTFGVLVRRHGFQYAEGTASQALPIVPDEYMGSAAAAVLGKT